MKVKICGVTNVQDAIYAAQAGADYIGIIFSKTSKRAIDLSQAKEIQLALVSEKVSLVGIFVDEDLDDITHICNEISLKTIQLHGEKSRGYLNHLSKKYQIFFAVPGKEDQFFLPKLPAHVIPLFDHHLAGQGKKFNWHSFIPPKRPWVLAGGLNKNNLMLAMHLLNPPIVDVASGVEFTMNTKKNYSLVRDFINIAKRGVYYD